MLSYEAARKIGVEACIDRLGRDFVLSHRDTSTSAYGEVDGGVYCFVGVSTAPIVRNEDDPIILTGDSAGQFPYRVSCIVRYADGEKTFIEQIVPQ